MSLEKGQLLILTLRFLPPIQNSDAASHNQGNLHLTWLKFLPIFFMTDGEDSLSVLSSHELKIVKERTHLLTPGPVSCHPDVLKALSRPMVHHLSLEFKACLSAVLSKLKTLFATKNHVYLHASTGSGSMESALVNTLSSGENVLSIVSGKFGERWADMAQNFGLNVDRINVSWGDVGSPNDLEKKLKSKKYAAVLTQACESSTAVLHPIKEYGKICQNFESLLMVDGISSVGAFPLPMDEWGIDVLVAGSQKALMLPAGLSMISLSEKAQQKASASKLPKFYWDLKEEQKNNDKGRNHFSSSVSLVRALDVALDVLLNKGLDLHFKAVASKANATKLALREFGLKLFSRVPSPSLTAFNMPNGLLSELVMQKLEKNHHIFLSGGQEHLAGKILRIGHMGYIENIDMLYCLEKLFETFLELRPDEFTETQMNQALSKAKEQLC